MDKTIEYIKKLEKAPEIQKEWIPKDGDFVWRPNEGAEYMGTWEFPEKFDIVSLFEYGEDWWHHWLWLPRQDQLQDALEETLGKRLRESNKYTHAYREHPEGYMASCILWEFYQWEDVTKGYRLFASMEQFWLGFVMFQKYSKIWNGKNWINK